MAARPPVSTLERLLSTAPATDEDDALLTELLDLFSRALRADTRADMPDSHPPAALLTQLTEVSATILDRSTDPKQQPASIPVPRVAARRASLGFGSAMLGRYPSLGPLLLGADSFRLVPLLTAQCAPAPEATPLTL